MAAEIMGTSDDSEDNRDLNYATEAQCSTKAPSEVQNTAAMISTVLVNIIFC